MRERERAEEMGVSWGTDAAIERNAVQRNAFPFGNNETVQRVSKWNEYGK